MRNRQNPDYPVERSVQDAVALVTAVASRDERLEEPALRQALEGTDHTLLACNLAELTVLAIKLMSQHTQQSESELLAVLGLSLAQTLEAEGNPGESF